MLLLKDEPFYIGERDVAGGSASTVRPMVLRRARTSR